MPEEPRLEFDRFDMKSVLANLAASAISSILVRGFPAGDQPARNVDDEPVKPLSKRYREYKSGTVTYRSDLSRRTATKLRARSGKPGRGPLVNFEGERRRLGPRKPVANQRLTDHTAKALGVLELSDKRAVLGFRDRRSRNVAAHLQRRNNFFGLTTVESQQLRKIAEKRADKLSRTVKVRGGVIRLEL
jgi:hypothetical protein